VTVYNFQVEDFHTCFVAQGGSQAPPILVHNASNYSSLAPGYTRLWRAVEPKDLADVMKYGDYNIHPNSTFKRFAFSESDVNNFIITQPGRVYTKTFVDIPSEYLSRMVRHSDPGGVGSAIGIDVYEFPEFYEWFSGVNIIP
jgi:filamentous hemagglutinin